MSNDKLFSSVLYVLAGLVAVALVVVAVKTDGSGVGSEYTSFAQCLTGSGVKHYTASWCPNCKNQKELFGNAWRYINAKECHSGGSTNNLDLCKDDNITAVPVWEFSDGSRVTGAQTLEFLSQRTGCALDGTKTGEGIVIDGGGSTTSTITSDEGEDVVIEMDESAVNAGISIGGISVE
jgi:hypothetical protein